MSVAKNSLIATPPRTRSRRAAGTRRRGRRPCGRRRGCCSLLALGPRLARPPHPGRTLGCDWNSTDISYSEMGTVGQTQEPRTTLGPTRMFVGGEWRDGRSGAVEHATSPVTGEDLGAVAQGDREDARAAIAAAAAAFPAWSAETAVARADELRRVADVCERRRDELARALTLDQGKPLHAEAYDEADELVARCGGAAEDG